MLIIPMTFQFASSSTGSIYINSKSASAIGQQVQSGGSLSLYFGNVMWDGDTVCLFLSTDGSKQIVTGDFVYTTKISVYNISDTTATHNYYGDNGGYGAWTAGNYWVNGTIAQNTPVGNFYVKAVDQLSSSVAVTDTYITVYSNVNSSTLALSPSSGAGGVPIQFTGSQYPPNSPVTISYLDPTFSTWNPLVTVTANNAGQIVANSTVPDLKKSVSAYDYAETFNQISYRSQINGVVCSYVYYNEYARGLKTVGNQTANGLYGNGTDLTSTVRLLVGDSISLSGKWFSSGLVYVRWDGFNVVGTVTGDQWTVANIIGSTATGINGTFSTSVTIPTCGAGPHYLAIEDSQTRIAIKIFVCSATLQLTPPSGPGGATVQFTGSSYPVSSPVTLSYQDPTYGTWNAWASTTSDANGNIAFSCQMPDLKKGSFNGDSGSVNGSYSTISFRSELNNVSYGFVNYNENYRGLTQIGSRFATGVFGNGTDVSSIVNPHPGDSLTISGKWFYPGIVYIRFDGIAVVGTVTGDQWKNAQILGSTTASATTGTFSTAVTIPTANKGSHFIAIDDSQTLMIYIINVSASVNPSSSPTATPIPSTGPSPTPSPLLPMPTLDVSCRSATKLTDLAVQINGQLTYNGTPIDNASIQLYYSVNGGNNWDNLIMTKTASDGTFNTLWKPDVTGCYLLKAIYGGSDSLASVTKNVAFALTPDPQQNVFSVTSNSTVSQFAFNSTADELSFTVSGPSETTGYVQIYIPKTLISDISTLKTYIDGKQISFNSESQSDAWQVTFSYSHSTHKITMALNSATQPSGNTPNQSWEIYAIIVTVIAAIAVSIVVTKLKHQSPQKSGHVKSK